MIKLGLDIYTYTREQQEALDAFDKAHPESEEWSREVSKEWANLPRSEDVPSEKHPDNINNRRYLRSSYNAGGFNRVVPEVTGNPDFDYYGILRPLKSGGDDEYLVKVDDADKILAARKRAQECADALEALRDQPVYRVDSERAIPLRPDLVDGPMDAAWALKYFNEERAKSANSVTPFGGGYSNAFGSFYFDSPQQVVAALPGVDILGTPCVHLITKGALHESYIESAHVLVEFCDELLELVKRDGAAYIHWSG